jgi:hypothetical protein
MTRVSVIGAAANLFGLSSSLRKGEKDKVIKVDNKKLNIWKQSDEHS